MGKWQIFWSLGNRGAGRREGRDDSFLGFLTPGLRLGLVAPEASYLTPGVQGSPELLSKLTLYFQSFKVSNLDLVREEAGVCCA